jgi:MFS transporter, DHA2 family, multidrug resistance protein
MSASIPANRAPTRAAPTASPSADLEDKPYLETRHTGWLMAAVMVMSVCQFIDMTVANVALPHMQTSLNASMDTISWTLTSYIIAGVMIIPMTGWLSDRFGSRNLYLWACFVFLAASALCGAATSLTQMVLFRGLQGVGAAFIGAMAQTIMFDINPPSKQTRAMSIWGMAVIIAPITGPFLGGYLTQTLNWRWVFYINLPIGIPALVALFMLLPSRPLVKRKLDVFGASLLAIGLCALQLMLDRGQHEDWFQSTEIVVEFIVMLSAFWIFFFHNRHVEHRLFPKEMLRNSNFVIGVAFMVLMGVANVALSAMMPTLLQTIYHYDVMDTGLLMAPRGCGVMITMILVNMLIKKFDARMIVAAGYGIAAYSLWMMASWSLTMNSDQIILGGFVQGIGLGLVFMPMNMIAFSSLDPKYRPDGTTLLTLARNLGSSFGISVIVTMLARNIQISHADIAANVTSSSMPTIDLGSTAAALGSLGGGLLAMIDGEVNRQAAMIAYLDNFYMMFWLVLCFVPLTLLLKRPK